MLLGCKRPTSVHESYPKTDVWTPVVALWSHSHSLTNVDMRERIGMLLTLAPRVPFMFTGTNQHKEIKFLQNSLVGFGRNLKWNVENIEHKEKAVGAAGKSFHQQSEDNESNRSNYIGLGEHVMSSMSHIQTIPAIQPASWVVIIPVPPVDK